MSDDRHSIAQSQELIKDPDELARREVENGVRQFQLVVDIIRSHVQDPERPFKLRPSHILQLHYAALEGIHPLAGTYRNSPVKIGKSKHVPPEHFFVSEFVDKLCDYVNDSWQESSPIHLAAFVLWRLNWIHPFADGNGRTSRAVMYLVLNTKLDGLLAGTPTIPDQIAADKKPYYDALEDADAWWTQKETVGVAKLETLLESMLAKQLLSVVDDASASAAKAS